MSGSNVVLCPAGWTLQCVLRCWKLKGTLLSVLAAILILVGGTISDLQPIIPTFNNQELISPSVSLTWLIEGLAGTGGITWTNTVLMCINKYIIIHNQNEGACITMKFKSCFKGYNVVVYDVFTLYIFINTLMKLAQISSKFDEIISHITECFSNFNVSKPYQNLLTKLIIAIQAKTKKKTHCQYLASFTMWLVVVSHYIFYRVENSGTTVSSKQINLLDHTDISLHTHHVTVPPVILEAQHQCVWLEATQTSSLGRRVEIIITIIDLN